MSFIANGLLHPYVQVQKQIRQKRQGFKFKSDKKIEENQVGSTKVRAQTNIIL